MKKKLLSILLSVAVAIMMIPATGSVAFADTSDGYGLHVGGVEVTAENAADILNDGGSASYDTETQQLTLDSATISYDKSDGINDVDGVINSTKDITIVLKGRNELSSNNAKGINVTDQGNLAFKSEGEAASLQAEGFGSTIQVSGTIDNSANITVSSLKSSHFINGTIQCKGFTNSGDVDIDAKKNNGIFAYEFFNNTGNVTIKDISPTGILCSNYNQTGGTIDLISAKDSSAEMTGIWMKGDPEGDSQFVMAGGKLNITYDTGEHEGSSHGTGIEASCSSFKISGGVINIALSKAIQLGGITVIGTEPEISGGTVNITADGIPTEEESDLGYLTFAYIEDITALQLVGPSPDGMKITVSNNVDGSDPVAYDPTKVINGYKYMRIEKPVMLKSLSLSKTSYYCTGKSQGPSLTVKDVNGKTVSSANYTVSGTKKATKPGTYKITVKGKGKYTGTFSKSYTIKVKPSKIVSLTKGTKSFTVKASKLSSTYSTGYQARYSLKKSMASAKTVTISSKSSAVKKTVKNLKKGKTYYVQVRTIKKVDGKKYYSTWSAKKAVKTK